MYDLNKTIIRFPIREGNPSRHEPHWFALQHQAFALQSKFYTKSSKVFFSRKKKTISNMKSILLNKIFDLRNNFYVDFFIEIAL